MEPQAACDKACELMCSPACTLRCVGLAVIATVLVLAVARFGVRLFWGIVGQV